MNRRDLLGGSISMGFLAGGAPGWLCAARAQQQNVPVIGLLDAVWGRLGTGVGRGLRENGFAGGRHLKFERSGWSGKSSEYQADQIARYAAKLVERQVALILAASSRAALAAKSVTDTTPVIFLADDPVAAGLVDRLTRPGGNLTGVANLDSGLIAQRIEIARELVPATNLVVLVSDPTIKPTHDIEIREAQAAAKALGLPLSIIAWAGERGFEPELAELPRDRKAVLVFGGGLPFYVQRAYLAYMAVQYGFPAIHGFREAAEEGGLASFGARLEDAGQLMGSYAARILKGDKPADLPVQKFAKTELVINRWPAKSLGLQIPSTLLARADEVIE
jgi:putative tryptophan/tyrosine transport system substrate-binding protein